MTPPNLTQGTPPTLKLLTTMRVVRTISGTEDTTEELCSPVLFNTLDYLSDAIDIPYRAVHEAHETT
jgi:hypothetical protein